MIRVKGNNMVIFICLNTTSRDIKDVAICDLYGNLLCSTNDNSINRSALKDTVKICVSKTDEICFFNDLAFELLMAADVDITNKRIVILERMLQSMIKVQNESKRYGLTEYAENIGYKFDETNIDENAKALSYMYKVVFENALYLYKKLPVTIIKSTEEKFKSHLKELFNCIFETDSIRYPKINKEKDEYLFFYSKKKTEENSDAKFVSYIDVKPILNNHKARHYFKSKTEESIKDKAIVLYYGIIEYTKYPEEDIGFILKKELKEEFDAIANDKEIMVCVIKFDKKDEDRFLPRIYYIIANVPPSDFPSTEKNK